MQIELNTLGLSTIIKRLSKGLVNNKFLPYTGLIMVNVFKDRTEFIVNDGNNVYLHKIVTGSGEDEFYSISVNGERFQKLLTRITSEKVKLKFKENSLTVVGNGTYTFKKQIDEVPFKTYDELMEEHNGKQHVERQTLPSLKFFDTAEGGLSKLVVNPTLMGYYFDNKNLVTTNGVKLNVVKTDSETENSFYLTTRMVDLLKTCDTENDLTIERIGNINIIKTNTKLIYGPEQPGHETYPPYHKIVGSEYDNYFNIDPQKFLSALSRIEVFDDFSVGVEIKDGEINLVTDSNKKVNEYLKDIDDESIIFGGRFNIGELKDLVSRHTDEMKFYFKENNTPIKLVSKGITQILAPQA